MRTSHPPVRTEDPYTSWAAAKSVYPWTLLPLVLQALKDFGPLTHEQIIDVVRRVRPMSDSGVRTRVSELVELGLVEKHPTMQSKSRYGRTALLWRVVEK